MSGENVERIFASFKEGGPRVSDYDPNDSDSVEAFIAALIEDARDYEGAVLAAQRDLATRYYYGMLPALNQDDNPYSDRQIVEDGGRVQPGTTWGELMGGDNELASRSSYVSTDVRDAVLMMLPSLIRIFAASENVVNLVPRTPNDVAMAEQATNYVNYTFWQDNPGFLILYGAFKDALTLATGFVKWWTDDRTETERKTFVGITSDQLQLLISEGARLAQGAQLALDPLTGTYPEVAVEYEVSKPLVRVAGVPPEEMRLDRWARTFSESRIVGQERVVPIEDLTAMGYPRELCADFIQTQMFPNYTMEWQIRNPGRSMGFRTGDGVMYGEFYIRIDRDGDGFAELWHICTMGEDHKIVHEERANRIKFALFSVDPISHTIVGDSLADLTMDLQRIKTNMMRGVLDSLAESINSKMAINELVVNIDDALNDDLGAVIRTRGDPTAAVAWHQTPFVGQQAMPMLEMLDAVLQRRTGLSDAAKGLDPKALQSSTMIGVEAIISGQQERTELVARVLAETGFKDLFQGLFNEVCENPNQKRTLRINGKWIPYDTSTFDASMSCEVNPTLGKGSDSLRMMTLQQIKQDQQSVFQMFGPQNPVVGIPEMLNTVTDMLSIANIKNPGRYFKTPDPQTLQMIQSAPKEPDAMTLAAKAQFEKVKSDSAQAIGDQQFNEQKLASDDAFRKQKLDAQRQYEQEKLALEADKLHSQHAQSLHKVMGDIVTAHIDAEARRAQAEAQVQAASLPPGPNGGGA